MSNLQGIDNIHKRCEPDERLVRESKHSCRARLKLSQKRGRGHTTQMG